MGALGHRACHRGSPGGFLRDAGQHPAGVRQEMLGGVVLRRRLLAREGVAIPDDLGELGEHAGVDDVLDAAVAAWSARRYAAGIARSYPDPPQVFSDGHPSAIWA